MGIHRRYEVVYINHAEGIEKLLSDVYEGWKVVSVSPSRIEPDGPHRFKVSMFMVLLEGPATRG